jgi:hypothetical protein
VQSDCPASSTNQKAKQLLPIKGRKSRAAKVARYGQRYWAVYLNGELLAVTVYKKGAVAVQDALMAE